ncbi:Parasporal protein [Solibacillus isronensis B3W22]|uniref:Parasporal protein n=1 Tax=Solibacillus isronensis B3W22 TaxID=1224748 RepID=K1LJ15_9BACL|nr:S-layer homology domain-containing protein [Solibacillus isronensis]AMO84359.1 hypothetical protein SOLI23_01905 [Solibacillus silvestris]EKB44399.1 Parasporal protein [Solibacillus isronensis B3W22]
MANQPKKYTKFVAAAATATLVASAIVPVASAAGFSDVADTNSHAVNINALAEAGIIGGYPDGTFKPNQELTRGQVVKMLGKWVEAQGFEIPADYATKARFTDLAADAKDQELVKYAALVFDTGVFAGSNGALNAGGKITRENMALVLDRAFKAINDTTLVEVAAEIEDVKVADLATAKAEAREAIQALRNLGISGVENFMPKDSVTRAQFATFLNKTINTDAVVELTVKEAKAVDANTVEVTLSDDKKHTVKLDKALEANKATEIKFTIDEKEYTATVTYVVEAPVVKALNAAQVEVTFGEAVDKATVIGENDVVKNVTFTSLDGKAVTKTKAVLSKDGKVLTITALDGEVFEGRYDVKIENVKNAAGKAVEKFEAKNLDFGKDKTAPVITGTEKVNATQVKVNFSEPLKTIGNWTFTDAEGKAVDVTVGSFNPGDTSVVLTIADQKIKAGASITATVIGATDIVGNLVSPNPTSVTFTKGDKDGVAPAVSSVTATGLDKLEVKFTEEVQNLTKDSITVAGATVSEIKKDENDSTKYVVTLTAPLAEGLHKVEIVKEQADKVTDLSGEALTVFSKLVEFKADKVAPKFVKSEVVVDETTKEEKLVLTFDKEVTDTTLVNAEATELNKDFVTTTGKFNGTFTVNAKDKTKLEVSLKAVTFEGAALAKDATYTVKFAKDAVADTNTTANKSEAFTVSFKRGVDGVATTSDKPEVKSVTATDSNTLTVVFDKEVVGATATKVENYAIAGLTFDSAILKNDVDGKATTVVLTLAKGTNKLDGARDLTIANVAAKNGAVMETATVTVKDMLENVAPTVQTAKFTNTTDGKVSEITLTFSEAVTLDADAFQVFVGADTTAVATTSAEATTAVKEVKIAITDGLTTEQIAKTISVKLASGKNVKDVNLNALELTSIQAIQ